MKLDPLLPTLFDRSGSRAGMKFATPTSSFFLKNQRNFTFKESAKITKFELGGGLNLFIHKIKLCSTGLLFYLFQEHMLEKLNCKLKDHPPYNTN